MYKENPYSYETIKRTSIRNCSTHTLTFVGGILIAKGLADDALVFEVVGGAVALTGAIWSIVVKAKA